MDCEWRAGDEDADAAAAVRLSFVVCLSDDATLKANLLASPCLGPGSPHEVIAVRNAPSAAAGLSLGSARARNELVVCVHQDVVLPAGWDRLVADQYGRADRRWTDRGRRSLWSRRGRGVAGTAAGRPADRPGRGSRPVAPGRTRAPRAGRLAR